MASASASSREPWALPEFVREKAERARRLLTEDVRYEGSADLQYYLDSLSSAEIANRLLLPVDGHQPTPREEQQALVAFLHSNLANLLSIGCRWYIADCFEQLREAALRLADTSSAGGTVAGLAAGGGTLLAMLVLDSMAVRNGQESADSDDASLSPEISERLAEAWQRYVRWDAGMAAAAAELEAHQRTAGFEPLLTAAQLQVLGTALAVQHCHTCDAFMLRAQQAGQQYNLHPRQPLPAAVAATRRLLQLQPDSAAAHFPYALLLQRLPNVPPAHVLEASEAALQQAEARRSHSLAAALAISIAAYMLNGGPGSTWRLADMQRLIASAERALKLWRRWGQQATIDNFAANLVAIREHVRRIAGTASSSQAVFPPLDSAARSDFRLLLAQPDRLPTCSGCGASDVERVKPCSACRAAAYCSTACQRRHWPQHKAECRRLAAQRASEAGGGLQL